MRGYIALLIEGIAVVACCLSLESAHAQAVYLRPTPHLNLPPERTRPLIPRDLSATSPYANERALTLMQSKPPMGSLVPDPRLSPTFCEHCMAAADLQSNRTVASIFFAPGKSHFTPEDHQVLKRVAEAAKKDPLLSITISGYTDAAGSRSRNAAVSLKRAMNGREVFLSQGLAPTRIETFWAGEEYAGSRTGTDQTHSERSTAAANFSSTNSNAPPVPSAVSPGLLNAMIDRRIDIVVSRRAIQEALQRPNPASTQAQPTDAAQKP